MCLMQAWYILSASVVHLFQNPPIVRRDRLLTDAELAFFVLSGGVSFLGTIPYYHEVYDANCRFPSVNGLVPRNITHSITFDKPLTETAFIAQVRATNP